MRDIPAPGEHGGDGARVAAALGLDPGDVLDLSASLNPFAPDVVALARRHLGSLRRYPDVAEAEALVAELIGVPSNRLVLTAGGSQAIALVAEHLRTGWVEEPEFSLYSRHLESCDDHAALQWRSDPRNPTGELQHTNESAGVWDEAFLPLSAGVWTRARPGWSLGSLTKAFACPGLRLGFAVAPSEDDATTLRQHRPAWAVGGLACALLPDLVDLADPPGWTKRIQVARGELAQVLRSHGLEPLPSDAPWLLVHHDQGLRDVLAPQGVVVRDCASFGMAGYARIAVPDDSGLEHLDLALRAATERIGVSHQ